MTQTVTSVASPLAAPGPGQGAGHHEYGADALIVCDNLVRIYQVEQIEVQALQGLDLLIHRARWSPSSAPRARGSRRC